jgi:hypothetical protein
MDMRFYWIQDRVRQGQFLVYWRKGADNLGDYFTTHHPTTHHRHIRVTYLRAPAPTTNSAIRFLQGCVHLPPGSHETDDTRRSSQSRSSHSLLRNSNNNHWPITLASSLLRISLFIGMIIACFRCISKSGNRATSRLPPSVLVPSHSAGN